MLTDRFQVGFKLQRLQQAMDSSESTPAVAGLCNLGNTCYLNAALQALASSRQFVNCIATLSAAFESTAEPEQQEQPSFAQQLQAGLTAAVKFVLQGPADEAPPSLAQLTAQAAQGHLTRALHKLLTALQPQQQQQQQHAVRAVHPGEVLSRLSWYVPAGVLEPGLQQDAAEALELLCDAVATELTCWQQVHARTWQQQQQGAAVGLRALLQASNSCPQVSPSTAQQQQQQQQQKQEPEQEQEQEQEHQHACVSSVHCHTAYLNGGLGTQRQQRAEHKNQQQQQQQQQQHHAQRQQELPSVPQRLPVVGYTTDEITCTACGDRFPCSSTPFMVLPLSLPHTPLGTVPPGTTLAQCLARYSQSELLQGVECMKCSLRASLQPLSVQLQQLAAHEPEQQQQQQQLRRQEQHVHEGEVGCDHQQQEQQQEIAEAAGAPQRVTIQQQQQQQGGTDAGARHGITVQQQRQQDAGAAQGAKVQQTAPAQHMQQQGLEMLTMLHSLIETQQPLPPLDYPDVLQQQQQQQQQQLTWVPKKRYVFKRTVLGKPPPVLLLQLQRAAHFAGHGAKVQGHVQFPLVLDWSVCQTHSQQEQQLQQQEQQQKEQRTLHELVAVVQHLGSGHSWGHYRMYRRVQAQPPPPPPPPAAAADQNGQAVVLNGCQGRVQQQQSHQHREEGNGVGVHAHSVVWQCDVHNSSSGGSKKSRCYWLRVSDSSVSPVSEQEVLQCQATLLVYEKRE